jgi:uncharacterized protein (DUF1330 family)
MPKGYVISRVDVLDQAARALRKGAADIEMVLVEGV